MSLHIRRQAGGFAGMDVDEDLGQNLDRLHLWIWERSGRVLDSRPKGRRFEPHLCP